MQKFIIFFILILPTYLFGIETVPFESIQFNLKIKDKVDELSRVEYIYSQYKDQKKYYSRLNSRLNSNKIYGLELVIASSTKKSIESRWGHALLRFVDNFGEPENDLVLGYIAYVNTKNIHYLKGLSGKYPLMPQLLSLRTVHKNYTYDQNRSLERYIISSDKNFRKNLIKNITVEIKRISRSLETNFKLNSIKAKYLALKKAKVLKGKVIRVIGENKKTIGFVVKRNQKILDVIPTSLKIIKKYRPSKYTFLKNNCAGALINLLKKSGFRHLSSFWLNARIPKKLPSYLFRHHVISTKVKKLSSAEEYLKNILKIIKVNFIKFKKMSVIKRSRTIKKNIQEYTLRDKLLILDSMKITEELYNELTPRKLTNFNFRKLYNFFQAEENYYQLKNNELKFNSNVSLIKGRRKKYYIRDKKYYQRRLMNFTKSLF